MKFTIGKKIAFASAALVSLSLGLGSVALWQIGNLVGALQFIAHDSLPGVSTIDKIDRLHLDIRGVTLHHMASPQPEVKATKDAQAADDEKQIQATVEAYSATVTGRDRELLDAIRGPLKDYLDAARQVRALSLENKTEEAVALYDTKADAARARLKKALADAVGFKQSSADRQALDAAQSAASGQTLVWIALGLSIAGGSLLAYLLVRGINRALMRAASELSQAAVQVATAAGQFSSSSDQLAQGASEQAASLEETSASSAEINAMSQKNAEHSESAAVLMTRSKEGFRDTNVKLEQMVVAMGEIGDSSNKVSKIIRVIDEIAFQTNILALNAAVEAARAGESGMGFAVVADEVRNLAQRCASAAKDTAGLIEESVSRSNDGKLKVEQVAGALRTLSEESTKVMMLVDEVNAGSQEQAKGFDQIRQALSQMECVTQTLAAGAEQGAASAEELTAQSETLRGIVEDLAALVGQSG